MDTTKILITAGIGDFITLDAYITDEERNAVREVYFAARGRYGIEPILDVAPIFPNLEKRAVIWDTWTQSDEDNTTVFGFRNKTYLRGANDFFKWGLDTSILDELADFNILDIADEVLRGERRYNGGGVITNHTLADISRFNLPTSYGLINAYSPSDKHFGNREFNKWEWNGVIRYVERRQMHAVVVNQSDDYIPEHPLIINLNNQTSVPEGIEIAKNCKFYIGIDSWLSPVVPRVLNIEDMFIKTENSLYLKYRSVYCAPHVIFPFIRLSLKDLW